MKSRSVSITGATGFVGWHVAEAFTRAGWDVRGVVRRGNRKPVPQGMAVVESDLTADSLQAACAGADVLVHSAALIRARDEAAFNAVNVEGARAAAQAAAATGARLVLISSQAAGGQGTPTAPRRELDPPAPVNAYGRSKLASEAVVRDTPGLEWTILRPCAVYGPRDHGFLPLYRMARKGVFFVPSGGDTFFTLIFIADLVRAVILAAEHDAAAGETLFIGHPQPRTGGDVMRAIAAFEQRPFRPFPVPAPLFTLLAKVGDLSWKLGVKPLVDSGRLVELRAEGFVCSVDRARSVLGFTAETPLEAGVGATAAWYREHGWT
ncbi:MAG: NAD(P)-dependent oxidoreductase [Vicinamibacterales bacterium]